MTFHYGFGVPVIPFDGVNGQICIRGHGLRYNDVFGTINAQSAAGKGARS
jgi:hypothetical protein